MILLWVARLLDAVSRGLSRASDRVYRRHYARENRKAFRASVQREREKIRRDEAAIDTLIAETRPVRRVGAPIHRDR